MAEFSRATELRRRMAKAKVVECEVLDEPKRRPEPVVQPKPEEKAELKRKQLDAQMAYLRENDPKMAKKVWRRKIFFDVLYVISFVGICLLAAFLVNGHL